jgi:hypothetical protein
MTLFGDLSKAYDKAQQLSMLPTLLVMKGASKAGDVLKKHTFLGKTVKDANTADNKRIWRGSRGLRKHILEPSIKKTDEKSGGAIKDMRNSYESYQNWGKNLAERHALSSHNPSPKQVSALAERFRNNTASDEDKEKIKNLKLRFDPTTKTLVPRKPLAQEAIFERLGEEATSPDMQRLMTALKDNRLSPEDHKMLQAFGLKAYTDGSMESIKELPINPLEKKLCGYFDEDLSKISKLNMEDISDENLKLNLRTMRAKQFESLAPTMMDVLAELHLKVENGVLVDTTPKTVDSSESKKAAPKALPLSPIERSLLDKIKAQKPETDTDKLLANIRSGQLSEDDRTQLANLNFKVLDNKTLVDLEKDELSPSEIQLYKLLANEPKADITHIHEMKNEGLKEQFGYIRNQQLGKLDSRIQLSLNTLGLSIDEKNGRILDLDSKNSLDKRFPEPIKEDSIQT